MCTKGGNHFESFIEIDEERTSKEFRKEETSEEDEEEESDNSSIVNQH